MSFGEAPRTTIRSGVMRRMNLKMYASRRAGDAPNAELSTNSAILIGRM